MPHQNDPSLNSRQIETFVAVMKAGTVSGAAIMLGISQPAVSRTLAQLEKALGFLLFDRISNRIVATSEGRLLYEEVLASFRGMDRIRSAAARIRDRGAGEIRIASLSVLGSSLVPRAVRQFRETHPTIGVTLMVLPSRDVREGVIAGEFDLGLAADEVDVTGVVYQPFVARHMLCAIPHEHPLSSQDVITPDKIAGQNFVAYVPEDRARQRFDRLIAESGAAPPRVVVETIYASTVLALVSEGVGIGLISPHAISNLNLDRVVLKPFEPPVLTKSVLLLPSDRPKSLIVSAFINLLMSER